MKADYTLAIDPGLHGCGAAFGIHERIARVGYIKGDPDTKCGISRLVMAMATAVCSWDQANIFVSERWRRDNPTGPLLRGELVIEMPQVYKASHQRGGKERTDPEDIVNLAACVGGIIVKVGFHVTTYHPAQWKGQVPKEICHARAIKALSQEELQVVNAGLPAKSLAHNVLDAVAIYLKHVGRVI